MTAPPQPPPSRRPGRPGRGKKAVRRELPPLPQTKGMSLRDFPELVRHLPQHKPWVITIGVISVVMLLGVCGFSSWLLLQDGDASIGQPTEGPTVQYRDISSREVDSTPMTEADAFPIREIVVDPAYPPYVMIGEPDVSEDCSVAADGEVRRVLTASGCSQVLRASFASYDNQYFVTAGIMNLPDVTVASALATDIRDLVQTGQGQFLGYVADPADRYRVLYSAAPHLGWEVSGHFLLYTVVVRQDGADIAPDETGAEVVVYDMRTTYLKGTVITQWSIDPNYVPPESIDPSASADASPSEG